ncbi:hypothetical protein BFP70_12290 [Thioclava sp. SK-1]|uniref:DUF2793 domain-containing protein n=1 Tax=Thioclava sp. SK-1 TaxID=1889770 RepID=UPI000824956E|nr:DUF2793 domain-containing protein [Thioclava sp. SK-1]OCX63423.1 hypothetical protein BFP70_12290 [Thioclava sp. SK-1]
MPDRSDNLSLPYIQPSQAQKHVTHNEAVRLLDALVQLAVESLSLSGPPAVPQAGQRFIVPAGGTQAWAGQDHRIAIWQDTAWAFLTPSEGWQAWVVDDGAVAVYHDGQWQPVTARLNVSLLGVNTAADATNRLASAADATLLTHVGAGHQLKLNKATATDTASLLFQSNWAGRAEMGLTGGDGFTVKVSEDGVAWHDAMTVDPASGRPAFTQGAQILGPLTGPGIVGPQGSDAVIEQGENANGRFTRLASGLQICESPDIPLTQVNAAYGGVFGSETQTWGFPEAFVAPPSATGSCSTDVWLTPSTTQTACVFRALSYAVQPLGDVARLVAIGRWK